MTFLDRLLRACATGYGCRSLIGRKGLIELGRLGLWQTAAQRIIELDRIHPRAQECWLDMWILGVFCGINTGRPLLDLDLTIDLARKILPPYWGGDVVLYRGQLASDPVGMSWSWLPLEALHFAKAHKGDDAVILRALVPASEIICAPALEKRDDNEFVIDPRGVEFEAQPVSEALSWVGWHALGRVIGLLGQDCINPDGSIWLPDTIRGPCLEAMLRDPEAAAAGEHVLRALGADQ